MTGARSTKEALKYQEPSRAKGTKKDKKKYCKGKVGRDHDYHMGLPSWASTGKEWHCETWNTVHMGRVWYCRHVMVCSKCGRQKPYDGADCPDRPEDDGTIDFR